MWEVLRRCMWFATFCPLKVVKSRETVKNLTLFYTLLQITIHEFGASWNRRSSKKAISVCALFCVRGHSEVCSISSIDVLLLKGTCLDIHARLFFLSYVWSCCVKWPNISFPLPHPCSMFASTLTMRESVKSRYSLEKVTWQTLPLFFSERRWAESTLCLR